MARYPILITLPHCSYSIPEELAEYIALSDFELFTGTDTCAENIFDFPDTAAVLKSRINRLILNLDRSIKSVRSRDNGIMRIKSLSGRPIYASGYYPDELAISALIERYYVPFHDALSKILKSGEIKLVIDCHTVDAVAPATLDDAGKPRPIVSVSGIVETTEGKVETIIPEKAGFLRGRLSDALESRGSSIVKDNGTRTVPASGIIAAKCLKAGIPYLKISVSKCLFLNEEFFSYEYLKVDEIRLKELRSIIWKEIEEWFSASF